MHSSKTSLYGSVGRYQLRCPLSHAQCNSLCAYSCAAAQSHCAQLMHNTTLTVPISCTIQLSLRYLKHSSKVSLRISPAQYQSHCASLMHNVTLIVHMPGTMIANDKNKPIASERFGILAYMASYSKLRGHTQSLTILSQVTKTITGKSS